MPDYLIPLGRTVGLPANGAVSNVSVFPDADHDDAPGAARGRLRRRPRAGAARPDPRLGRLLVPRAPRSSAPSTPTRRSFVTNNMANAFGARRKFNQLSARIAVSEAAAWTGRRWFGGNYEIIPNGVDLAAAAARAARRRRVGARGSSSSAATRSARACRSCCAPSRRWPSTSPAASSSSGPPPRRSRAPRRPRRARARSTRSARSAAIALWQRARRDADVLCAPSLSGESFGMVLTEAFAAGTPVIASAIAGYSDVVNDGVDGILIPPGDPQRLAEELLRLHHRARAARGDGARRPRERRALRLAPRRLADRARLRAGHRRCPRPPTASPRGFRRDRARRRPTAARGSPPSACPRPTRRRRSRLRAAAGSPAASASASRASSASGSPTWRRSGSASTTSSRAPSAPTSPGSWSRPR